MSFQFITLIACLAGMSLLGLVYNAIPVYFMVAGLLAVLVVSYLASRLSTRALACRRETADRVFEQEPLGVGITIANQGRFPRLLLTVVDRVPEFVEVDQPPEFVLPALWRGEEVRLSYQARPQKRGVFRLGPLTVSSSDPFGIFPRFLPLPATAEAVVYPRPVPLDGLIAQQGADPGVSSGERSRTSDADMDFYSVREYQPGDDLRRIHWPTTARHSQLTVMEFERGAASSLAVVLDTRAGTEVGSGLETTLELGVKIAASLVHWTISGQGVAFLALRPGPGPLWVEVRQPDREYEALEALARAEADAPTPVSWLLDWASQRLVAGSAVCVITAAPDDELPTVAGVLRQSQIRVGVVLIDPTSFDPGARRPLLEEALRIAGAHVAIVRRGDDLREALRPALGPGGW